MFSEIERHILSLGKYLLLIFVCSSFLLPSTGCGNVGEITVDEIQPSYSGAQVRAPSSVPVPINSNGNSELLSATLTWDSPTTNVDKSCVDDIKGYKLYYGKSLGLYDYIQDLDESKICVGSSVCGAIKKCTHTISGLSRDTWYFVVTAYDFSGNESVYSNVAIKKIP